MGYYSGSRRRSIDMLSTLQYIYICIVVVSWSSPSLLSQLGLAKLELLHWRLFGIGKTHQTFEARKVGTDVLTQVSKTNENRNKGEKNQRVACVPVQVDWRGVGVEVVFVVERSSLHGLRGMASMRLESFGHAGGCTKTG